MAYNKRWKEGYNEKPSTKYADADVNGILRPITLILSYAISHSISLSLSLSLYVIQYYTKTDDNKSRFKHTHTLLYCVYKIQHNNKPKYS